MLWVCHPTILWSIMLWVCHHQSEYKMVFRPHQWFYGKHGYIHEFQYQFDQSEDYKIGIYCFYAKHAALTFINK